MKEPGYIETLRTSFHLVISHKLLWVLGLLAGLLGPMGMVSVIKRLGFVGTEYAFFPRPLILPEFYPLFGQTSLHLTIDEWVAFLWLLVMVIGALLFVFVVAVIAQAAMIHAVGQYETWGQRTPDFAGAWHAGASHVWRILGITLLSKIVILFVSFVMAFATVNALIDPTAFDSVSFVVLFVLSVIVAIAASFLAIYASGYVVIEEYSFTKALHSAWVLFKEHWLVSLEMGVIMAVVNAMVGAFLVLAFFVLLLPTVFLWMFAISSFSMAMSGVAFFIGLAFFIFFALFVVSLLSAFTTTVWTHLFMKMHRHGVKSHILVWSGKHYRA